jgi:SAM-dependent methyltransferase
MCWGYFDTKRIVEQVKRVLLPDGTLLISSIVWSGEHYITRRTNELLAKYNNKFTRNYDERDNAVVPEWSRDGFQLKTYHHYQTQLPFTRESWRGRMRATKFIGAALPAEKVTAFDREHASILEQIAPDRFEIPHDIRIQIFQRSVL